MMRRAHDPGWGGVAVRAALVALAAGGCAGDAFTVNGDGADASAPAGGSAAGGAAGATGSGATANGGSSNAGGGQTGNDAGAVTTGGAAGGGTAGTGATLGSGGNGAASGGVATDAGNGADAGSVECNPLAEPDPNGVYVSRALGSDTGAGTAISPLRFVTDGVARAREQGKNRVYVAAGSYEGRVTITGFATPLVLSAGWDVDGNLNWTRNCAADARDRTILSASGVGGVLIVDSMDAPVRVEYLTVQTAENAPAASVGQSAQSLYGVQAYRAEALTLLNVAVTTGSAADGGDAGTAPLTPTPTDCTRPVGSCGAGEGGEDGTSGETATLGTFSGNRATFVPGDGSRGVAGADGQPGTAGGNPVTIGPCITGCSPQCQPYIGGYASSSAGTCGCGGRGGGGGPGGRGGGASVALLAFESTVTVRDSRLTAGSGGDASSGSAGAYGVSGTHGAAGAPSDQCILQSCVWNAGLNLCEVDQDVRSAPGGAMGGMGGLGGDGGPGTTGAGGPSYAVVLTGGSTLDIEGSTLNHASGGRGAPDGPAAEVFNP